MVTVDEAITHTHGEDNNKMAWTIDNAHSEIGFSVKHLMISRVRGEFKEFGGTVEINLEDPSRSSAEGYAEVASIRTGDADRDQHLRSADFFNAEEYPRLTFRSTRVEKLAEDQYRVTGDLTIRDVTNEVVFNVTNEGVAKDPWGGTRLGLSATTKIDRKAFGLTWNVALEAGGWLVGDDVKIDVELQLVKQPETEAATA